ncbi:hypothetical protein DER29_6762 [Micromonospora sp. M71_S20]|uniref:hypothetical protein n=1 Tax=Micromonospora sp. M71_S20 TaxID=592872 RepID=UPI000F21C5D6|nr:hypothetical protein [Micromonospora sp. M71_S20]RLK08893.1 hypothetical protein DER29_6762 [Micromonospora sp. M71_S20]
MTRVFRIVAAVLVSGALAACGSDGAPEPATAPPPASAPAPEVPSSVTPSSAAPASSAAGRGGYANPDEAMAGHLSAAPGVRYLGLCKNARRDPTAVCALRMGFVDQDEVYGLGAPHSDIVGFLLLRKGPDGWRVVDDYAPDDGQAPPPAWMAGVA